IPCVKCNQTVKFKDLLTTAKDLGADCLATGHYIQRKDGKIKSELHRGFDNTKDQSYFLFSTTQEQLDFLRFPLGHMVKDDTRELAHKFGLKVADKPDSQDICFVPNGGYSDLVKKLRPEAIMGGNIVDLDGNILGTHDGIINYTIGQRRGIGIGGRKDNTDPLYVVELRPDTKEVVVGGKEALGKQTISITNINWIGDEEINDTPKDVQIKIRSVMQPVKGKVYKKGNHIVAEFDEPEFGVSPGQACVFYNNERMLGGGWITDI
ncbi:MAG: tRNA 2-thiouridine(34) synthase MnmA, partial [Alphaproteobacteria bacterium]